MTELPCSVVQDLLPLYKEGVLSPQSAQLVQAHLASCPACRMASDALDTPIEASIFDTPDAQTGLAIIRRMQRVQARVRYPIIIFLMAVSVGAMVWSRGVLATIPFVLIAALLLRLLYRENVVMLLSTLGAALALGALHDSLGYAIFFLAPLALACCASGLLLGGSIAAFLTQAPQGAPWRARTRVLIAICCALGIVALLVWLLPAFFGIGGAL